MRSAGWWFAWMAWGSSVLLHAQESRPRSGIDDRTPWTTSRMQGTPDPPLPYRTELAFPLKFTEPLELVPAPGSRRLFVAERYGKILSFVNEPSVDRADGLIDLGKVIYGLAFHPRFATNGYLFVTYVRDASKEEPDGTRVSRFTVDRSDPPVCDPTSERVILEWPSGGHNGGCLRFGPDGMLYIATGDSSGIADGLLTGQDPGDLSGSILRIDVDTTDGERLYSIPSDNPFIAVEGARPEVWAYGLRQPWKMHFDAKSGDLWTGNVGQDLWEQVFLIERGGNYGWSVMEGSYPFRPERKHGPTPFLPPIVEHDHAGFRSITGGVVYHGTRLGELRGAYIYGDYDTGKIWMFRYDRASQRVSDWRELDDSNLRLVSFAEDNAGEFYLVDHLGGGIHRLVPNTAKDTAAEFPRRLSETGLFQSTADHRLAPGILPYSVNAPQWCDGGIKDRFFGLPGSSQIEFDAVTYPQPAPGAPPGWRFPHGAVVAETISLEMESGNPASRRRLETRVLHYEQLAGSEEVGDQFWRGYTYVWNDDQTDAVLLDAEGTDRTFAIADRSAPGGKRLQTWRFPSRAECTVCHNMAAKYLLGLTTLQVNRSRDEGGKIANQLAVFDHIGLFTKPLETPREKLPRLAAYDDLSTALEARARSYLHANCSHCHRKWGGGNTEFQLLATQDLKDLGIVGVRPAHGGFYIPDAEIAAAGEPLRSVLFYRMAKLGPGRMPRLGSERVDEAGLKLIHDWLASLPDDSKTGRTAGDSSVGESDLLGRLIQRTEVDPEQMHVIKTLLNSTPAAMRLMLAVDSGRVAPAVRESAVTMAAASPDAHIRELFEKYLPEEQRPKRLGNVVRPDILLAMPGDAGEGQRLFVEAAGVQCRNCHKIHQHGTEVGPELTHIGKKYDRRRLLDNILNPSREMDPKYVTYMAETSDGRLFTGLLIERSADAIVLKDARNQLLRLNAADVEQLTPQQQSLMPDLLLRDMTAQQVADLLAYLSELK